MKLSNKFTANNYQKEISNKIWSELPHLIYLPSMTENKSISAEQVPTEKEIELVGLIARDMRPMEIAEQLDLSNKTVEAQIFSLKRKFAKKTNAGLVFLFMQNQLIG